MTFRSDFCGAILQLYVTCSGCFCNHNIGNKPPIPDVRRVCGPECQSAWSKFRELVMRRDLGSAAEVRCVIRLRVRQSVQFAYIYPVSVLQGPPAHSSPSLSNNCLSSLYIFQITMATIKVGDTIPSGTFTYIPYTPDLDGVVS
jgi:hypothetical protein